MSTQQTSVQTPAQTETRSRRYDAYLPLLLTLIGIVLWLAFQSTELVIERSALSKLHDNQESTLQTSQKMRKQLDQLASGVAKLAQQGNPNAKLIVDDLRHKGITINPSAASAANN